MKSFESVAEDVSLAEGVCRSLDEGQRRAWVELASESSSLAIARGFVSSMLELWDYEDPDEIVPLLTSEIVSNAVRHAAGNVGLELTLLNDEALRVQARHESPGRPVVRRCNPDGIGGHGLTIIRDVGPALGGRTARAIQGGLVRGARLTPGPLAPARLSRRRARRDAFPGGGLRGGDPPGMVRDLVPLEKEVSALSPCQCPASRSPERQPSLHH